MKNRKLLIGLSMGLTFILSACSSLLPGAKKSSKDVDNPSSKNDDYPSSINSSHQDDGHTHVWSKWEVTVEATCEEPGTQERYCLECGKIQSGAVDPVGHTWGSWEVVVPHDCETYGYDRCRCLNCGLEQTIDYYPIGHSWDNGVITKVGTSCTDPSIKTYTCAACGKTKTEEIPSDHVWLAPVKYEALSDEQVSYETATCSACNVTRIVIKAVDGTLVSSSRIKSGTPVGYMKLNKNGDSISYKITLPENQFFTGMLYQRGTMDSFSSNTAKTYAWVSGSSSDLSKEGNFSCKVNGKEVDKSAYMDLTYGEMLSNGELTSSLGGTYSPVALCPIGNVELESGVNELVFSRLGSYNLCISEFVFIGSFSNHSHTWSNWVVTTAPGCETTGQETRTCSGCGKNDVRDIDPIGHNFDDGVVTVEPTEDKTGVLTYTCLNCGTTKTEVISKNYVKLWTSDDIKAGISEGQTLDEKNFEGGIKGYKFNKKIATITLNFVLTEPQTVDFMLLLSAKHWNESMTFFWFSQADSDKEKTAVLLDGEKLTPPENDVTFDPDSSVSEYGMDGSNYLTVPEWKVVKPGIEVSAGSHSLTIQYFETGYAYYICGAALAKSAQ